MTLKRIKEEILYQDEKVIKKIITYNDGTTVLQITSPDENEEEKRRTDETRTTLVELKKQWESMSEEEKNELRKKSKRMLDRMDS